LQSARKLGRRTILWGTRAGGKGKSERKVERDHHISRVVRLLLPAVTSGVLRKKKWPVTKKGKKKLGGKIHKKACELIIIVNYSLLQINYGICAKFKKEKEERGQHNKGDEKRRGGRSRE